MQKLLLLILVFTFSKTANCQNEINYGNNNAAGKYYKVRGINIYAEQYGKGEPLLVLHGNGGSINSMAKIISYFSKHYKVIAVDSRAQGKSTDTSDFLSFEMMADDNAALLDQLNIDSTFVIGWSDGGIVALLLAMRHPDKVIKLASTGANLVPDTSAILPSLWKSDKVYFDSMRTKIFTNTKEKNDWKLFSLIWLQPNIEFSELQKITSPSLIISGDGDIINLEHTIKIYQNIPKANLWILPNSGHGTFIEYSDEFNRKVHDFFQNPFTTRGIGL